jgi:two-component system response regulator CitB
VLLDNYLPDGKGVTLMTDPALATSQCSVIFITAASDMETCSQAIRNGAFDYILKPVSWKRLSQSLERFIQFYDQQREWKIVDQQNVDSLYQLQAKNYRADSGSKGIEEKTLALVQGLFSGREAHCFSVDEVVSAAGLSKTTARRYLEHGVETGFLEVEMLYGKIGHPRRLYRRARIVTLSPDEGLKTQKPRCSLISSQAFWISCAFCLAISIISGGSPFATSLSGWCSFISLR